VRDVDDVGGGVGGENYSLDRRDEVVCGAKVCEQGNDRVTGTLRRGDTKKGRPLTLSPRLRVSACGFHL
jgi:hypothetical protein